MPKRNDLLDDIFLQPWFMPQRTAHAIRELLPDVYRHKMRFFFDDYGCLKCEKKGVRYGSNGICKGCVQSIKFRLFYAVQRRWKAITVPEDARTFKRMADAQAMLKDLVRTLPKKRPVKSGRTGDRHLAIARRVRHR